LTREGDFSRLKVSSNFPTTDGGSADNTELARPGAPRKMLEIVTDLLGSMAGKDRRKNTGKARDILGGVMGWEYLLGEIFGADHVMYLIQVRCWEQTIC
jgi:hypothetical protein